jgi:ribosomal RNA assembly protein
MLPVSVLRADIYEKTFDPAAILNARDLIKLLARSVPAPQAIKILEDGMACDIIKIRSMVRNKERFVKRRQRILGQNGTSKLRRFHRGRAMLTDGSTESARTPDANIHPGARKHSLGHGAVQRAEGGSTSGRGHDGECPPHLFDQGVDVSGARKADALRLLTATRIKRELAKDPALANEDWSRYLPNFKKRTLSKRRIPFKVADKSKKNYTPFPPAPEKSKVDMQIESGEYFLGKEAKQRAAEAERAEKAKQKKEEKKREREKEFVPPEEDAGKSKKRKKSHE